MHNRTHPTKKPWICCLLILALCSCSDSKTPEVLPRPVRVANVKLQSVTSIAKHSGEIRARYESPLAFQVTGKITKRLVDVGTMVKSGQLLATLDPADFRLGETNIAAQLAAAQADLSRLRKELGHENNLLQKNLSSPASFERHQDQVKVAEARVAEMKANLALNSRKSGYTELRAEHAGVITSVDAEVGQVIPSGQGVLRLAQTAEKEVIINVPENRIQDLRSATAIQVSLWANPGVFYQGKVREISPGVDPVIRTYTVKITLVAPDATVDMGMTATVDVQKQEPKPLAKLPLTAITQHQGQTSVWIVDQVSGIVQPRTVTVANYEDENARVTAGVQEGEWVVTAGVHKLIPGQKVRILGATQS